MRAYFGLIGLSVAATLLSGCAAAVTTSSLLAEMTDLERMAEFPDPPFTCKQFSSYDRAARSPDENWFANADCGQYLRVEEVGDHKEYVMMDADGPGAVVRIWSANPSGTLRVYLDHSQKPAIEAPLKEYLGGDYTGMPGPIAGSCSKGWNSYFPIPYSEHCKVTSDQGDFYYHVNYRTYPSDTRVKTFSSREPKTLKKKIARVNETLSSPESAGVAPANALQELLRKAPLVCDTRLAPGETLEWATEDDDAGAIVALYSKVEASDQSAALRKLLLTIEFDGDETVVCPLGDLFGSAPGVNPYKSLPAGVRDDGLMWSHWLMPFQSSAHITIKNTSDASANVALRVAGVKYRWTDRSMHFHAKWRGEFDVPTRPMRDWNYLIAQGQGVFAGAAFSIANPVRAWWGEGDEKIYVDGETFPSHFGTGTEDYYGYAWCSPELFTHAYHNQTRCDGPDNYGYTSVNRWHIIDRIPFTSDFRFDMELWHWIDSARVDMSVVSYWYARPGSRDEVPPIHAADLRVANMPEYVVLRVPDALEGEEMTIEKHAGTAAPQRWGTLSNEAHLWWRDAKPGDRLVLGFDVAKAGQYRVFGRFLSAADYGVSQLYINDAPAGEPIDLYHDGVAPTPERELGVFDLPAGRNTLTVEIVGANENAAKSYMFGLDYLRLEPTD